MTHTQTLACFPRKSPPDGQSCETFDFVNDGHIAGGVDRFQVLGIEASVGLDPFELTAFVTGLTFVANGTFNGTMDRDYRGSVRAIAGQPRASRTWACYAGFQLPADPLIRARNSKNPLRRGFFVSEIRPPTGSARPLPRRVLPGKHHDAP